MPINLKINNDRKYLDKIITGPLHFPNGYKSIASFNPKIDEINKILEISPIVKLIDIWEYDNPYQRCQWYAFHKEEWYKKLADMDEFSIELALIENGFHILNMVGYRETEDLEDNLIVAYHFSTNQKKIGHYGIYNNGMVRSKWSHSHVYEHPIDLLPAHYGDTASLFIK